MPPVRSTPARRARRLHLPSRDLRFDRTAQKRRGTDDEPREGARTGDNGKEGRKSHTHRAAATYSRFAMVLPAAAPGAPAGSPLRRPEAGSRSIADPRTPREQRLNRIAFRGARGHLIENRRRESSSCVPSRRWCSPRPVLAAACARLPHRPASVPARAPVSASPPSCRSHCRSPTSTLALRLKRPHIVWLREPSPVRRRVTVALVAFRRLAGPSTPSLDVPTQSASVTTARRVGSTPSFLRLRSGAKRAASVDANENCTIFLLFCGSCEGVVR